VTMVATLTEDAGEVSGFVRTNGVPVSGAMLVLVPENSEDSPSLFRRAESATDGSFILSQIAPGRYTVVAITDGWELEWARATVIGRYLPLGKSVSVPTRGTVTLPEALTPQQR
ncbi:carboxypeptidase-like regulatory domain-containing protein, partial [Silvibacterium sp.]|uniref:carboxypeptidase-like regulatory domain-containing protein n=1 Tax=Silvibacterium sp. TaxID=1964179 RepID=UPI0039E52BFC